MTALFAFLGNLEPSVLWTAVVVLAVVLVFSVYLFIARFYKRCPSNRILVIYGWTKGDHAATCIAGGAKLVIPFIQDYAWLSLEPMQIEIPLKGALSLENIRVNVPSVFTVAIGTSQELMQNAAVRLLGLKPQEIKKQSEDIIFGQLRQVLAAMPIENINRDRDQFLTSIQHSLEPELRKIGLVLINVNITDITDESGYIEAIGQKAASEAIQKARGDVAENEKMGAVNVANAERDKQIQVANAEKIRTIGTREAEQERAVRVAELEKTQNIGEQKAVFEKEAEIKRAERDMRIQNADAIARAVEGENLSKADIAASRAKLQMAEAEAFELGETKRAIAEAAVAEAGHHARAKAALAEAERIEAERRAALEAPAKAEKAKLIVEAEALAERHRIEAEGMAKAIFSEMEAKARGEYELLAKKGEGFRSIIEACGSADAAFRMMMLEHFDNLIEASATAISSIKFDKVVVWDGNGGGENGTATANWLTGMAKTLPPMLEVMKDVAGIDLVSSLKSMEESHKAEGNAPPAENG